MTRWIWQRAACWSNAPFKYVMSTSHESITFTKYSPRRQGICRWIKDNIPCTSGRIGVRTMCHTRWTIQLDALGSNISNCVVLQSMWNYAKDVDRARYGDEGKNSRRFVSYEHIPLPVRYHVWRVIAETRRQLELNYATQVASSTNVNKRRRWLWRRSKESGAMSIIHILDKGDQQSGSYLRGWTCAISKKKSAHAIWW